MQTLMIARCHMMSNGKIGISHNTNAMIIKTASHLSYRQKKNYCYQKKNDKRICLNNVTISHIQKRKTEKK